MAIIVGSILALNYPTALGILVVSFYFDSYLGRGGIVTPNKLLGIAVVVSWLVYSLRQHRRYTAIPHFTWLATLAAAVAVSIGAAASMTAALSTGSRYFMFIAIFIMVAETADSQRISKRIVSSAVLGGTVSSCVALAHFVVARSAASGPLASSDDLGFLLASTLPVAVWWSGEVRGGLWRRRVAWIPPFVILTCVLATFSRGAILSLLLGICWAVSTKRVRLPRVNGAILVLILVIVVVGSVASAAVVSHALQRKQLVASSNVTSRVYFWQVAVEEFRSAPFTGVGPGNYTVRFSDFAPPFSYSKGVQTTHNSYLNVLAELGIGGFVAFVAYLVTSLWSIRLHPEFDHYTRGLVIASGTALVIALVGAFFLTEEFYAPLWLWPALAVGVARGSQYGGR